MSMSPVPEIEMRNASDSEQQGRPKRLDALPVLMCALVMGGMLIGCTFGLWFAPGWSNGWGLPQNVVWPTGLGIFVFLGMVGFGVVMGMMVRSLKGQNKELVLPTGKPRIWLMAWTIVSAIIGILVFASMREPARVLWP